MIQNGGIGNIGIDKSRSPGNSHPSFQEMLREIRILRERVSPEDRQVIDHSLQALGAGENAEPGTVRRALNAVAGVATMVGEVGVPVVEAVRRVLSLFAA
ncbi:hypothetical protein [Streptomyces sp. NPDC059788]|uniref:hypothetical protein n=1 Tax=Streptomyces sp. NPDC059788 TaxID=3346948 RepID=UPI00364A0FE5